MVLATVAPNILLGVLDVGGLVLTFANSALECLAGIDEFSASLLGLVCSERGGNRLWLLLSRLACRLSLTGACHREENRPRGWRCRQLIDDVAVQVVLVTTCDDLWRQVRGVVLIKRKVVAECMNLWRKVGINRFVAQDVKKSGQCSRWSYVMPEEGHNNNYIGTMH